MDYDKQNEANQNLFAQVVKDTRPDLWALMDIIDNTSVNWSVLWRTAQALHNLASDTKYGQVVIEVENNTVRFVRGVHSSKVNEPLILEKDTLLNIPDKEV